MVESSHRQLAEDEARPHLALRRSGAMLACVLILVVLSGCAGLYSMPTQEGKAEWAQQFPLGKDKAAADQHFEKRNNETGSYKSYAINSELTSDGTRTVYRYYWAPREPYLTATYWHYDLTFVNDALIRFEAVDSARPAQPTSGNTGMGFLCKDAIARGDQGGIRTHCH